MRSITYSAKDRRPKPLKKRATGLANATGLLSRHVTSRVTGHDAKAKAGVR